MVCYKGDTVMIDEILDATFEKYPTKEEIDKYPDFCYAGIVYDDSKTNIVPLISLRPIRHLCSLSSNDLKQLYQQIELGSMTLEAYENDLGVLKSEIAYASDGFLDAIGHEDFPEIEDICADDFAYYCMNYR